MKSRLGKSNPLRKNRPPTNLPLMNLLLRNRLPKSLLQINHLQISLPQISLPRINPPLKTRRLLRLLQLILRQPLQLCRQILPSPQLQQTVARLVFLLLHLPLH